MPIYAYRCEKDHITEVEHPIGTAQRMTQCACGSTARLSIGYSVNVAPSALETKGATVREIDAKENRWHKDMPAYYRMRHNGMQPEKIDGAAALEDKAGDQLDVRWQKLYDQGISRERIMEGTQQAAEIMAEAKAESA